MKKLISIMLALVFVFSMATVAFAAEGSEAKTFTKTYSVTGAAGGTTPVPNETLQFSVTVPAGVTNPTEDMISVGNDNNVTVSGTSNTVSINLPNYTVAGKYNYTVTETAGSTQGVDYSTTPFNVQVLVYWDATHENLLTEVAFTSLSGNSKIDSFTNTYGLGTLTVKKTVYGNIASQDQLFDIKVTLTAAPGKNVLTDISVSGGSDASNTQTISAGDGWTGSKEITIKLKHDETVTISNIPAGVTYSVAEDSKHIIAAGATSVDANDTSKDYSVTYDSENGSITAGSTANAVVTNTKTTSVDTGISLDSVPFILILAVCAGAAVLFVIKRRRSVEF